MGRNSTLRRSLKIPRMPAPVTAARGEASPGVQGSTLSPGRSRTTTTIRKIIATVAAQTIAVTARPTRGSSVPHSAPYAEVPATCPNAMNALARPRSLSGRMSIAIPSTATSWVAANALTTNPTAINGPRD